MDRWQKDATRKMHAAGVKPPGLTREGAEAIYESLSSWAHHTRGPIVSLVSDETRVMPTGPHPDRLIHALWVGYAGDGIFETSTTVGFSLGQLLGPDLWFTRFQPTFEALRDLKAKIPLDATSLVGGDGPEQGR
jgi:hypothetical protein